MIEGISLAGSETVVAQLQALPAKLQVAIAKEAVAEANKILAGVIRGNTPVDSGALRKSVGAVIRNYRGSQVTVGVIGPRHDFAGNIVVSPKTKKKSFKKLKTGSKKTFRRPAHYAHLIEGGTSRGVQPNPFMKRSLESVRTQITAIFEQAVKKAVESQ